MGGSNTTMATTDKRIDSDDNRDADKIKTTERPGNDIISTIDGILIENILLNLDIRDLLSLCQTSKTINEHVKSFALHYVLSHRRLETLNNFLTHGLCNADDILIQIRIAKCGPPNLSNAIYYFKCIKKICPVRRFSVTEAIDFPHYGNPQYIVREEAQICNNRRRDVVHLRTVCWLHFKQVLSDVKPGTHQVSVHFRLGDHMSWHSGRMWGNASGNGKCPAVLQVVDEKDDELEPVLVEVNIEPEYWRKIKEDKFENGLLRGKANVSRSGEDWHLIKFKPFTITKQTNLAFVWKDVDNPWWKDDMYWDYVEIREM